MISVFRVFKLIKYIAHNDINVVHLMPKKLKWFWTIIIRQIAALYLYCPPLIVGLLKDFQGADALVGSYIEEFMTNEKG